MSECREILEKAGLEPLWADSLGAKSMAFIVRRAVAVDPGAAAMHPSYPLPESDKRRLRGEALSRIRDQARSARLVVITHYHYDHYARPWDDQVRGLETIYLGGKTIVAKNPNTYINESQWVRARRLYEELARINGMNPDSIYCEPGGFEEPEKPGDSKSASWLQRLVSLWRRGPWVCSPARIGGSRIILDDNAVVEEQDVRVQLLGPHYHGELYERTGWVTPVLIQAGNHRILYTSDLMGPVVEDYAIEAIRLKPDIVIADGPPTYMYPYRFGKRSLEKAVANMTRIVVEASAQLILYDHHVVREPRWRQRVAPVLEAARKSNAILSTVAECMGRRPLIEEVAASSGRE